MRKLEKAWQAKFWKFNRFIARVLLLWLFWRTLLILSLWLSLCLKYCDKRSETFPVVICWYAAAGDTPLHCTLTHIRASFFKLSWIFSLIKLFLIKYNFRPGKYVYPDWCWSLCDVYFFIFFAMDSSYFSCILINHNDVSFCLHHGSVCCCGHWGQQWHFPCCEVPHRNICNLHAFYRDNVWTSYRMTWNNTQWISFNDISFRAIVFKINSIPWTFQCNPGRVRGRGCGRVSTLFCWKTQIVKVLYKWPLLHFSRPALPGDTGQGTIDSGTVLVLNSAVKRSISFTIGFHNYGEGPYH